MMNSFAARRLLGLLLFVGALSACESVKNVVTPKDPPACPRVVIDRATAYLTRFASGPGRDITDIVLEGEMLGFDGFCEESEGGLLAGLKTNFSLTLGPGAPNRTSQVEYFVALIKDDQVLTKEVMNVMVQFPDNIPKIVYRDEQFEINIPLAEGESGPDYKIYIGFQLSRDELEYNRKRKR